MSIALVAPVNFLCYSMVLSHLNIQLLIFYLCTTFETISSIFQHQDLSFLTLYIVIILHCFYFDFQVLPLPSLSLMKEKSLSLFVTCFSPFATVVFQCLFTMPAIHPSFILPLLQLQYLEMGVFLNMFLKHILIATLSLPSLCISVLLFSSSYFQ